MTISDIHSIFLTCSSVSTDTRKIEQNSLFVALKGDRFDANAFASEALQKGAANVIIDDPKYKTDDRMILVDDALQTLQKLANYHRNFLKLPVVALTGSNGKTTTKELIHAVLSQKFKTKATKGNLNNHIGVPLTLLSFTQETEIGIVEMGANHQKEIEFLCAIAEPDYGYITNFGKAHLEGFGGVEGVIKGKSEMYQYLQAHSKKVFVNLDDALQNQKTTSLQRYGFSQTFSDAFLKIDSVSANPLVTLSFENTTVHSHLIGLYNANNICAAITIGAYFGVTNDAIKAAIEGYIPENNRSQMLQKGTNEIILDAYNANPSSMKVAIDNFLQLDKPNKLLILGDMFELGAESLQEHKITVEQVANGLNAECFFVGTDFKANEIANPHLKFFATFDQLADYLKLADISHRTILIKGSRGMALERVLEFI